MRNESTEILPRYVTQTVKNYSFFELILIYAHIQAITTQVSRAHYLGQNRAYLYTTRISPCDNYWLLRLFLYRFIGILHYIKPFYLPQSADRGNSIQIVTTPHISIKRSAFFATPFKPAPFSSPKTRPLYRKSDYNAQSFTKVYCRASLPSIDAAPYGQSKPIQALNKNAATASNGQRSATFLPRR